MNIQDVIDFSNNNPVAYVATIDNGEPRVRAMGLWFADVSGFYFQTTAKKDIFVQLQNNPNIEICFYRRERLMGTMLRISGAAEFLTDVPLLEKLFRDRPFLKSFGLTVGCKDVAIFRLTHGRAYFWMMDSNLRPKEYVAF